MKAQIFCLFFNNLPPCDCHNSDFCDPNHKHIVTGDLRIISNDKLRKLFNKGPNFREKSTINYNKCKKSVHKSLELSINKFAIRYKLSNDNFAAWKSKIMQLVDERINVLK